MTISGLFGRRLREARKKAGLTQGDLAIRSGIDRATISLIENGHEAPRSDTVFRLAEALNLNPSVLWTESDRSDSEPEKHSSTNDFFYTTLEENSLHPGLEELLSDDRSRIMLQLTPDEEIMLRSIRTRGEKTLSMDFYIDVLIAYRSHKENQS